MKKRITRLFFTFLLSAGLSNAAFAHPDMPDIQSPTLGYTLLPVPVFIS